MTFRTTPSLEDQYRGLKQLAKALKTRCLQAISQTQAGNTSIYLLSSEVLGQLAEAASRFGSVSAELAAYARTAEGDPAYDVAAEFTAMRAAVIIARDWMIANLPQSGGYLAERTINADGTITQRTVTPAQTAGLRTVLQAVADTIQ